MEEQTKETEKNIDAGKQARETETSEEAAKEEAGEKTKEAESGQEDAPKRPAPTAKRKAQILRKIKAEQKSFFEKRKRRRIKKTKRSKSSPTA